MYTKAVEKTTEIGEGTKLTENLTDWRRIIMQTETFENGCPGSVWYTRAVSHCIPLTTTLAPILLMQGELSRIPNTRHKSLLLSRRFPQTQVGIWMECERIYFTATREVWKLCYILKNLSTSYYLNRFWKTLATKWQLICLK